MIIDPMKTRDDDYSRNIVRNRAKTRSPNHGK